MSSLSFYRYTSFVLRQASSRSDESGPAGRWEFIFGLLGVRQKDLITNDENYDKYISHPCKQVVALWSEVFDI